MCTNGVNVDQFKMMLEQMDDQVALNRRWTHKLFHKADDNGYENTAAVLKEIQGAHGRSSRTPYRCAGCSR